ncbi:retinol dehydrogenase 14 [Neocloeon triangulifer]|uniref:retinol dehydrogenase 14 n=1 Tax=Neocloeon triangulifer TaxID=2078957 RepID=UPI00286F2FBE|nr:retinol dehydrogenase 14 [Neocloeon triangulifer]
MLFEFCCLKLLAAGAAAAVAIVVAIALYAKVTCGVCTSSKNMKGKTVIITGATSGIGKEAAKDLAKRGARLILACRTVSAAEEVKAEISKETGNNDIEVRRLDLGSFDSVREFAKGILASEKRLDVLIHNAGCADTFNKKVSPDGIELTLATNHYGPFLLTHLLIDLLKKSKPSRIVVVASSLYVIKHLTLDEVNLVDGLPALMYYRSKFANIAFTLELARKLEGTGVTANCLHPGLVDTGIWRSVPFPMNLGLKVIIKGFFKTPKEGAQTTIHLAASKEVEGVSGKYFSDCKESSLNAAVQDRDFAKKFWEISEKMVKLQAEDPKI